MYNDSYPVMLYFVQDTVAALREEVSTKELNISELKSSMKQVSLQLTVRLTFLSPSFLTSAYSLKFSHQLTTFER
jgi:hypothetical protein